MVAFETHFWTIYLILYTIYIIYTDIYIYIYIYIYNIHIYNIYIIYIYIYIYIYVYIYIYIHICIYKYIAICVIVTGLITTFINYFYEGNLFAIYYQDTTRRILNFIFFCDLRFLYFIKSCTTMKF